MLPCGGAGPRQGGVWRFPVYLPPHARSSHSRRACRRNVRCGYRPGASSTSPAAPCPWPERVALTIPPQLQAHVAAGTSPNPSIPPAVLRLLVKDQPRRSGSRAGQASPSMRRTCGGPGASPLTQIKVLAHLWHGDADNLAPAALGRLIADAIPRLRGDHLPRRRPCQAPHPACRRDHGHDGRLDLVPMRCRPHLRVQE